MKKIERTVRDCFIRREWRESVFAVDLCLFCSAILPPVGPSFFLSFCSRFAAARFYVRARSNSQVLSPIPMISPFSGREKRNRKRRGKNRRTRTRSARHAKTPLFHEISRLLPWFISNALCLSPVISPLQNLSYRLLRLLIWTQSALFFVIYHFQNL